MFLDSNIFIKAFMAGDSKETEACHVQLKRIASGEMHAHTSVLVLNEVLYHFETNHNKETALKIFGNILIFQNLEILPVDKKTLSFVPEFSKEGLDATDAYHAATMKANGISTICSYDKDFDKIKSIKRQEPK